MKKQLRQIISGNTTDKKRNILISILIVLAAIFMPLKVSAQKLVESVVGIVGNEVIFLSDIENNIAQQLFSGDKTPVEKLRCMFFEDQLMTKLFLDQARIDSIEVSNTSVEGILNMQLNKFITIAGSEKALEDYFKKSITEIKADLRESLKNQQIINEVQNKIAENITVSPSEVKKFYSKIPYDSLPVIPAKVEISIIQIEPPDYEMNKVEARQKLLEIRSQIIAGKSFSALATLYSEDTESAKKGGEIGYMSRGELEKPYADVAFSLNKNSVSKIVETKYGFHIIQLIDRMGDMVNTRHILIRPKVKPEQEEKAMAKLDSIARLIRADSISFEHAAMMYSSHKDSRINGGKLVKNDPSIRTSLFALEELDKITYSIVRELKPGEISNPFKTTDENGNTVFRIVRLDKEYPAHVADLNSDYQTIYNAALLEKRSKAYKEWIDKKIDETYIKISDEFKSCPFQNPKWLR
ncbi:MAG: peptidylprolyl isomerase [Bacteroidales bacterium]|nr:peptidylprolyl isomerase [Bacteroidales bacterium]